jgi:hypothetical protein
MVYLIGQSRVFIHLYLRQAVYTMRGQIAVGVMAAFRSTGARQHAETLHGIDSGLIIVRVAQFRRPLGTFTSSFRRHRDIVSAKQNVVLLPSIYPKLISHANLLATR